MKNSLVDYINFERRKKEEFILIKNQDNYYDCPYHRSLWFHETKHHNGRRLSIYFRITRLLVIVLSKICDVDLCAIDDNYSNVKLVRETNIMKRICNWYKKKDPFKWITVILVLMSLHVSCNIFYQYEYDFTKAKLAKYSRMTDTNAVVLTELVFSNNLTALYLAKAKKNPVQNLASQKLLESKKKLEVLANVLKFIGAPHMEKAFLAECLYITSLLFLLLTYIGPQVYVSLRGRMSLYFSRHYVIYEQESREFNQLIDLEVNKYLESSRNHVSVLRSLSNQRTATSLSTVIRARRSLFGSEVKPVELYQSKSDAKCNIRQQIHISCFLERQLVYWNNEKLLRPFNRLPKWVDDWALSLILYLLICLSSTCIFNSIVAIALFDGLDTKTIGMCQAWILFEVLSFTVISTVATNFYGSMSLFTCLDQIRLLKQLNQITRHCTLVIRSRFYQLTYQGPSIHSRQAEEEFETQSTFIDERSCVLLREQVNANLLYMLMFYKISEVQQRHLRGPFGFALTAGLIMLFAYPILLRTHLPYFNLVSDDKSFRHLMIQCFFIVPPYTFGVLSICTQYQCCVRLFQAMASCLAHIIDIEQHLERFRVGPSKLNWNRKEYNVVMFSPHLVSLMRKVVSNPQHLEDECAVRFLGIRYIYANMFRLYFWFSIIVISIITYNGRQSNSFRVSSFGSPMSSLLGDPFGLY